MGKKKEKQLAIDVDITDHLESSSPSLMQVMSKKSKKHKRKKTSKREKLHENNSDLTNQIELNEALVVEDIGHGMEQEISVDDIEMEVEEVIPNVLETNGPLKVSDSLNDKSVGILMKTLQKSKSEKMKSGGKKSSKKKDGSKGDDDTDSEEERWLDAIESGKLEEVDDELKRMKNPRLMTARQRAMLEKRSDGADDGLGNFPAEPLLALPSGFKEKVLTEEMLAKKAIKSKRRRQQAQEKREEDKKKTVDRLLKKQDSKAVKTGRLKFSKNVVPILTYMNNKDGISLSFPLGMDFPITPQTERTPPKPTICGVGGCLNLKKYTCSKTGLPLCSLQCYKANLEL